MGCWRVRTITSCECSWVRGRQSALQRASGRSGAGTELGTNKADVYGEIIKSSVDKAESTWVWVWLWKSYTSILVRSLLLLQTAPRSQGQAWIPGGICTVLLEQKTPQTIALSWKICNFKWQIGKLRESVRIISLRTRKRTRNRIAKLPPPPSPAWRKDWRARLRISLPEQWLLT